MADAARADDRTVTGVRSLECPSCGAGLELRGMAHTLEAVCGSCGAVVDATDPSLQILSRFADAMRVEPRIPLGTRGTLHGRQWEAIGFQRRTITVEGTDYSWQEYLLFNPYHGFRYLTEYDGHWNDVETLRSPPVMGQLGRRIAARLDGVTYQHFQHAEARTTFAIGEFPWRVRAGDTVESDDFVAPPRMLSREKDGSETTWSRGTYLAGAEVWKAFALPGSAPPARGVFADQPSPFGGRVRAVWRLFALFALIAVLLFIVIAAVAQRDEVLREHHVFTRGQTDAAFVTRTFDLRGRTSNVEVTIDADIANNWIYLDLALINEATGTAYDFGREVSYYFGVDGGERWSEGGTRDRVFLPAVPSGRYYLRVEPEGPTTGPPTIGYTISLRRDVPRVTYLLLTLLLLVVPAIWVSLRSIAFERTRWMESDYPPVSLKTDDE